MLRTVFFVAICTLCLRLVAQYTETELKVYTFNDGLSHRNVFDILQDSSGLLWMATIDGLNRFDGYSFRDYKQQPAFEGVELVKFLRPSTDGQQLFVAAPNYLIVGDLKQGQWTRYPLKKGAIGRRENLVPTAMEVTAAGVYLVLQDESNGKIGLYRFRPEKEALPELISLLGGQYTKRPLAQDQDYLYFGALENELWILDPKNGKIQAKYPFPSNKQGRNARITAIQAQNKQLWVLMDDGRLFYRQNQDSAAFQAFLPLAPNLGTQSMQCLLVNEDGSIVIGGFGRLLIYDPWTKNWEDLDAPIRQLTRNTCTYRDILLDLSGVLWAASDFGAIRISRSDHLFTQYLSGGSEYCSNVYCSTRGITEDDNGRIYISYYNSIHVLDPTTNDIRPLFPANDYFNYPYGLVYHQGHLYTGDGHSIRLSDLKRQLIFPNVGDSEGVVARSPDSLIWFSHDRQLLIYKPATQDLQLYRNSEGKSWANISSGAEISFLLPQEQSIFIGSKEDGLYHLDLRTDRLEHWTADSSKYALCSKRINSLYLHPGYQQSGEEWKVWRKLKPPNNAPAPQHDPCSQYELNASDPLLFIGTALGLQTLNLRSGAINTINENQGLPNNFINGILPEGDSVIWVSTDYGLCRYSFQDGHCINFFTSDGLSADEFNRISFHRANNGRLYFGGLNGINAFSPDERLLEQRQKRAEVPLLLTQIDYIDGRTDSLKTIPMAEIAQAKSLDFKHNDRLFIFTFSLADYRFPSQNRYSYFLEGYDKGWSAAATDYRLRLNDLPPGEYILHLRARVGNEDWLGRQLSLPIHVQQPYYYSWWFWASLAALVIVAAFGLLRYRVYTIQKKRKELEVLVEQRTAELQKEQEKSEALLLNILPAQTANELKENGKATARRYEEVTVFFSDFVAFTAIANAIDASELVEELDFCFRTFDEIVARYGLEKIKTIGDAYLFVGGLNQDAHTAAIHAIRAARDIQHFLKQHAKKAQQQGKPVFNARIGLHTGALVTGVVGTHKFAYDIWGETVNIAARMESHSLAGAIVISETTKALVGSTFDCQAHGTYQEHGRSLEMWLVN